MKLVDEHRTVCGLQPAHGRRAVRPVSQHRAQPRDKIVEGEDAECLLTLSEHGAHLIAEDGFFSIGRGELDGGLARLRRQPQGAIGCERWLLRIVIPGEETVGATLFHELFCRGELFCVIGVAQHAHLLQCPLAELVNGEHGCLVKVVEGGFQSRNTFLDVAESGEVPRHDCIVRIVGDLFAREMLTQGFSAGIDSVEDPGAQLGGGVVTEGDHEDLIDAHASFGDVSHCEAGDGEGFTGARARLKQQGGVGERAVDGKHVRHHEPPCSASGSYKAAAHRSKMLFEGPGGSSLVGGSSKS